MPGPTDIVRATIQRYGMISPGQHVGVAVSGGADSVCLLAILRQLAPEMDLRLTVLHLNHGLRGTESDADEEFVRRLAASFDLPAVMERTDVRSLDPNLEQAGRKARYDFFARARAGHSLDRVATGHTRSDQAETVFYRLMRGSGTAGLAGIRPLKDSFICRPLIELERVDIENWLRSAGLEWREDSSNRSPEFVRNRLRHEILPRLAEELNPGLTATLARTATIAADEEAYWQGAVDAAYPGIFLRDGSGFVAAVDHLGSQPPALARRLLRRAVELVRGDTRGFDSAHIERIFDLVRTSDGSGRAILPGIDVFRSFEWIRIGPLRQGSRLDRDYEMAATVPGSIALPSQSRAIVLEEQQIAQAIPQGEYTGGVDRVDLGKVHESLVVRNWHPGDHYARAGHSDERIKQMFQSARIPIWERQGWPILTSGDRVVWARSFGPAAEFAVGPDTVNVLLISEREILEDA